jgi:hypothetical protein
MFWNRWSLAWLGIWLAGAFAWGMFLVFVVMTRWPTVPPFRINGNVLNLVPFLLTWFTVPALAIYLGGLFLGWTFVRIRQLPVWSSRWWTLVARTDHITLVRSLRRRLS